MQAMAATLFRHLNEQGYKFSMITTGTSSHICCPLKEKGVRLFQFFVERRPLFKKNMRWSGFFYLSSKRNRKFNHKHLVQTKPMGENTISNIMKESVAGTSLKESENITNHSARKTTFSKLKKQRYKFPQRLRWSRRRRATTTLSCNIQMKLWKSQRWEEANIILILAVSEITTTVAPLGHGWQCRKKTNCLLHFRVLNLKHLSMNPAMMESQEQTMMKVWMGLTDNW